MSILADDETRGEGDAERDENYQPMLRYTIEIIAIAALLYLLIKLFGFA